MKEYKSERKGKIGLIGNLSLSFAGLERAEKGQQAIQGFFGAGSTSRAGSEAPLSKKAAGKRRASDDMVDLTLESSDIEEIGENGPVSNNRNGNGNDRSRSRSRSRIGSTDSDEIAEVKPEGPVYQCERCGATISLQADEGGGLEEATAKAKKKHEKWHAEQDAVQPAKKKVKRVDAGQGSAGAAKSKPKKKGQQKLKSFFKKS